MADQLSEKVQAFVVELEALCERYGFTLSTSGYDGLQVWPRARDERSPIHANGIEDRTAQRRL